MTEDIELTMVLADLPTNEVDFNQTYGRTNCWVTIGINPITGGKRLEIFPLTGGWLGVDLEHVQADAAPYHG